MVEPHYTYQQYLSLVESLEPFYVFGFGSLIWSPEFDYEKKMKGRVDGFHRRFGMWSVHYRGTRAQPGLVAGLDRGGYVVGMCFQVAANNRLAVAKKLWDREMLSYAYLPLAVDVVAEGANGNSVKAPMPVSMKALAFTLDPNHEQYVDPAISLAEQARIISIAAGLGGPNRDYFLNMVAALKEIHIKDDYMTSLHEEFKKIK